MKKVWRIVPCAIISVFIACPQNENTDTSSAEISLREKCLDKAEAFSQPQNAPLAVNVKNGNATVILENGDGGEFSLLLYCGESIFDSLYFVYNNGEILQSRKNSSSSQEVEMSSSSSNSNESAVNKISKFELTYAEAGIIPPPPLTENSPVEKVSFYEAILLCNKVSKSSGFDTVYVYDKKNLVSDSLIYLENLRILEGAKGYRLPTKEEYLFANENGFIEKINPELAEWLYSAPTTEYSLFELSPNFIKTVGLYRFRTDYPPYGLRLLRVY
ncbi:hypothetical protein AGMMS49938_05540 [Fibrobacterales bacterium]|nr:hypothetical protein AGMMS49938_05540 [Fibrobacterales bacterium]